MTQQHPEDFGANQGFIEDLYSSYLVDRSNVQPQWRELFRRWEDEGKVTKSPDPLSPKTAEAQISVHSTSDSRLTSPEFSTQRADLPPAPRSASQPALTPYAKHYQLAPTKQPLGEEVTERLKGAAKSVATNMDSSLEIPTATSFRQIPAKIMFDNRALINEYLQSTRGGKISFTHLIGYALIEALVQMPEMNNSYAVADGKPSIHRPQHINFGLAIDVQRPDGSRSLVVPSIKGAELMTFDQFLNEYEGLVRRGRENTLTMEDYQGTTVSLTNPGGIGTTQSVPRLMKGQGLIVGVGSMVYPAEFSGASDGTLARLGVSKVVTLSSTYDHRIIQGAQSGDFLRIMERKLLGLDGFYDRVFISLHVPAEPYTWERDIEYDAGRELDRPSRIARLIHSYRSRGHLIADLDPLAFRPLRHPDLRLSSYGLTSWDLDREFPTGDFGAQNTMTLREILRRLRSAYCSTTGYEYMHISDPAQRKWFQARLELSSEKMSPEKQRHILAKLNQSEAFEAFLHTKYLGQKRFSLEGGESLIPALDEVLAHAANDGLPDVAISMAHRGRLNVLTNIAGKSYKQIFTEFDGIVDPRTVQGSGDVKYHLGTEGVYTAPNGDQTGVYLAANPSHLEAASGVLEGIVRAKQDLQNLGDDGYAVLPILVHGDAAFAGQGVVQEVLNLSQLRGYKTGGTIHIIVNNQIGFTTAPTAGRSSNYATDIAKGLQLPIFHVNGDDPEAVVRAAGLAYEYRQEFNKDVIIDLICYRRRGHNEGDDPSMTQPVMYALVDSKRTTRQLYRESLIGRGELTAEEAEASEREYQASLDNAFIQVKEAEAALDKGQQDAIAGLELPAAQQEDAGTLVGWTSSASSQIIRRIGDAHLQVPEGFTLHPKIAQLFERRAKMSHDGNIDWGFGELLAFGSLLIEGLPVRMSGQDVRRGTFVQRHATVHDHDTGAEWTPLRALTEDQAKFWIYDSSLSEYSVMAFEYGYSVERPDALVVWEAQFGDFANGAQTVIDEFVSSAEQKWSQRSSLVLMLPHGFEGQGPDHSSARIERYLQLCAQRNMWVCQPSTPANHFHMLRTQAYYRPRTPLVVFTPKQLLRRRAAVSAIEDFTTGAFQPIIDEVDSTMENVNRVLLCSGRIYYDLLEQRIRSGDSTTAIVRIEQLYPDPVEELSSVLENYPGAEVYWVQDEPENQGPWPHFALNLFRRVGISPTLISRPAAASPSTGRGKEHAAQNQEILTAAFTR
ncbi:multifunctional oxoglutarate decarboxylase/oxoglutarate dehydrogenase thiamine pyrophosphate-binding subunit/dihydrolipoyllysine-residue succinyltransferase subunit [Actinomycetaceae bacterium L2_0104]